MHMKSINKGLQTDLLTKNVELAELFTKVEFMAD